MPSHARARANSKLTLRWTLRAFPHCWYYTNKDLEGGDGCLYSTATGFGEFPSFTSHRVGPRAISSKSKFWGATNLHVTSAGFRSFEYSIVADCLEQVLGRP